MSLTYLQPILFFALAALAFGIAAGKRRVQAGAALALFLASWMPFAALLSGTLEWRYPARLVPEGDADAIVVLSGGVYPAGRGVAEDLPAFDTYQRVAHAAWLYRNWKPLPIVASGGATGSGKRVVLAEVMRRELVEQGVPASMIWLEDRSRSTYENGVYSAELLRGKGIGRIVLVTEAYHMLRAERVFRRQGLAVTPAPCAYYSSLFTGEPAQFVPGARVLSRTELALHEWCGLLWYRLSGKA